MAAIMTSQSWAKHLEPGLRKEFFETYREKPEQFSKIFNVDKSNKAIETDARLAGFGEWGIKGQGENTDYDDISDPFYAYYRHDTFSKGFQVTKEMVDDMQYNTIKKLPKNLARAARHTIENFAITVLNNAFTADAKNPLGEALIADNHKLLKDGAGTSSNYIGALALTEQNLEIAFKLAREQVDEAGLKIQMNPRLLVIPPGLEFTAEKIAKSIQLPGTNDNDINPMRGRFQVQVMDFMTDDGRWFLIDTDFNPLQFFWREKLNFKADTNFDSDVAKYKGRYRCSCGWTDWRGIIGAKP